MSVLISVSTVFFIILCVLLVILILLQSDKGAGMGILGGSSQSAFGSSTADVITKITSVMVGIFMVGSLGLSIMESKRVSDFNEKLLKTNKKSTMPDVKGTIEGSAPKAENTQAADAVPAADKQKSEKH
jgi:preprotein translocase subunit SecG